MTKIITTAIIKGGTGKTTTAVSLAQAGVKKGKRVLCVDLDAQGTMTSFLNGSVEGRGSYELLHGDDISETIQRTSQGVDVASASPLLASEETTTGSILRLKKALESVLRAYDYIIIDTPPFMGEVTYNAINASDLVIVPLNADAPSLQGLYFINDLVKMVDDSSKETPKPKTRVFSVVTSFDSRPKLRRFYRDSIKENGEKEGVKYLGEIRPGIVLGEAQAFKESLFEYAPKSKPALDYMSLFEKIEKIKIKR